MSDNWLPKPKSFRLSLANSDIDHSRRVADFINWGSRSWNLDMLEGKVCREDLELIKTIPIPLYPKQDRLVWHYSTNGLFSVRSAYHVALQLKRDRMEGVNRQGIVMEFGSLFGLSRSQIESNFLCGKHAKVSFLLGIICVRGE